MSKSTDSFINLPDNCPWGVAVLEYRTGKVLAVNRYMKSIYGCEESTDFFQFFKGANEELPALFEKLAAGDTSCCRLVPESTKHGIETVEVCLERNLSNADEVWLYTLEHPVVNDELRFSSRSELKMLRVLLDNTLEYVFFRDKEGSFILTNEAFRTAISWEGKAPGVDYKIEDFVESKSARWMAEIDAKVLETERPVVNEVSLFIFKNGTKHWLQLTTVAVSNAEGELIGFLSVARDISDLKRTESELRTAIAKAHEATRAKGDFLAAMSHEIRTPINGIIGASELCRETPLDIEQRGYLETVLQCGTTLLSLVNNVLDYSKIEAGQLNLESLNFSPHGLIESLVDEFAQVARMKRIELVVGYDDRLPDYLKGDPTRVKQVFYNLLGNALKFTEQGEVAIRADVKELKDDSAKVLFSVTDSGIGISKNRQEAIFRSFTQADMSTTRKFGGSGLGLSISKELVHLMNGEIRVESEEGEGSRFEFEIEFDLTGLTGAEAVPYNSELAGLRVIIIDDNQTNCDLYQQMCSGWGYRSSVAKDGISGLAAMEEAVRDGDPFQLILLDQQMPGLNGLDLASLVRSRPDLRTTKILLLSSSLNQAESVRASEIGISRALSKPVKRVTLQEVILETFDVSDNLPVSPSRAPFVADEDSQSLNILLAEDNHINQDLARRRLQKMGHQVTIAENGALAVELVQREKFDCILMDIQMPEVDGFEATRRIRAIESVDGLPRNHIVAMTAHALKGDRERCLNSGMDDYISKPFRAHLLRDVLSKVEVRGNEYTRPIGTSNLKGGHFAQCLKEMDAEDRDDIIAAAPMFLKSCPKDILKLENALKQQDFERCYFLAHTLKGVSGIFRGEDCIEIAEKVEYFAKKEDVEGLNETIPKLIDAMQALATEVEFAVM